MNRQDQAKVKGYQAYLNGQSLSDNYYIRLGNRYSALVGFWQKGYLEAKNNSIKTS